MIEGRNLWKLREAAKGAAIRKNFKEASEDIAQIVIQKYLSNPESKRTVDQAVIDAIRQFTHGRSENKFRVKDVELMKPRNYELPSSYIDLHNFIVSLKKDIRPVAVLWLIWEFTATEISYVMGYTVQNAQRIMDMIGKKWKAT